MSDWLELAQRRVSEGEACALITVTQTFGSTPREAGARMLIARDLQDGTIGGGRLELDASARARALLASREPGQLGVIEQYNLGARLGQCCGGRVEVLIQRFDRDARGFLSQLLSLRALGERHACVFALDGAVVRRSIVTRDDPRAGDVPIIEAAQRVLREQRWCMAPRWLDVPGRVLFDPPPERGLPLLLFGAGHVGRALVHVVAPLGWPITWVETRDDAFPSTLPDGVTTLATDVPEACVDDAPAQSALVIMTHDHALDYRLCERALARADLAFCGLIGSRTKLAKFQHRLQGRGFSVAAIARLSCPIGVLPHSGKKPFEVAISAAAQLLQVHAEQREALAQEELR